MKKFKKVMAMLILVLCMIPLAACASFERSCKSWESDMNGGLYRIVNIYSLTGELIASYEGLIDIDDNTNGSIMFDLNGKRYVYYNAIIEVIEQ